MLTEECGIIAISVPEKKDIFALLYQGLLSIQHRGQDACGIAFYDGKIRAVTGMGLVGEVFRKKNVVESKIGIGHTRYPTTGKCSKADVQPTVYENVAVAHNGHIANCEELRKRLEERGYSFRGNVDSEPLCYIIHDFIKLGKSVNEAVEWIFKNVEGAYSVVAIIDGKLVVFRDPFAVRPLIYGTKKGAYIFASESATLDILGVEYAGDVGGGEIVIIENGSIKKERIIEKKPKHCMFEYVYFSRPDSKIDGKLVYSARYGLGVELAKEHPAEADLVVPVPDSSRPAARGFSDYSGIPYEEALIKNRYIARTFIMPTQEERAGAVKAKLNPIKDLIRGKRIILVDDSIVRGTTMREIAKIVRAAGAEEIHLRITCPPLKAPCFYGVDMSTYRELIANRMSIKEIKEFLGVESLGYLSIEGLEKVLGVPVCTSCLDGEYNTEYMKKLAEKVKKEDGGPRGCCKSK
ncbi:amidophosphoribosyltransferase [Candidatus Micrarchaeota archaeon]|nr:amidophosphoribosyltransferase [Candidatus Micrarchaeota archaeon]